MKCQNCDREMNSNDEFCGGCGSKLTVSTRTASNSCPGCMSEMPQNQNHCQKCGSSRSLFRDGESTQVTASASKSFRIPGIIFTIIGLAVVMFAFINYQSTGEALRTENNPGIGLQHVMSVPIGIVGLIVLIAGLYSLREKSDKR